MPMRTKGRFQALLNGVLNMRTQEFVLYTNPDGTIGYFLIGTETPEEVTHRLQKEGKRNIVVLKAQILYWSI
jgi:hypothetical protein